MQQIKTLMHKKMSRKEFLATLGFGLATIAGLSALLGMLGKNNPWQRSEAAGYGGGTYGSRPKQVY